MANLLLTDGINWGRALDGFLSDGMNWGMVYAAVLAIVTILLLGIVFVWQLLGSKPQSGDHKEPPSESLQYR